MRTYYNAGNAGREWSKLKLRDRSPDLETTAEITLSGGGSVQLNREQAIDLGRRLLMLAGVTPPEIAPPMMEGEP